MDNLDVNIIIQVFNEKVNALVSDLVVKEAMIRQLTMQLEELKADKKTATKTAAKKTENEDFKWGR